MQITINFQSKTTLDVEPLERIKIVKDKIYDQKGIRPDHQRLLFAGTELEDAKMISDYGIVENSRIDLVPLYPKADIAKGDKKAVKDFISFHSNCQEWMTESLVANGSLIEEKDKWKRLSYKLTGEIVQIRKKNIQNEAELQEVKEQNAKLKAELEEVKRDRCDMEKQNGCRPVRNEETNTQEPQEVNITNAEFEEVKEK